MRVEGVTSVSSAAGLSFNVMHVLHFGDCPITGPYNLASLLDIDEGG